MSGRQPFDENLALGFDEPTSLDDFMIYSTNVGTNGGTAAPGQSANDFAVPHQQARVPHQQMQLQFPVPQQIAHPLTLSQTPPPMIPDMTKGVFHHPQIGHYFLAVPDPNRIPTPTPSAVSQEVYTPARSAAPSMPASRVATPAPQSNRPTKPANRHGKFTFGPASYEAMTRAEPAQAPHDDRSYTTQSVQLKKPDASLFSRKKHMPEVIQACVCKKEEIKVPRPQNAFMLYRSAKDPIIRTELAARGSTENGLVSKRAGEAWKMESEQAKQYYRELAKEKAAMHAQQHPDYKYVPGQAARRAFGDESCTCGAFRVNNAAWKTKELAEIAQLNPKVPINVYTAQHQPDTQPASATPKPRMPDYLAPSVHTTYPYPVPAAPTASTPAGPSPFIGMEAHAGDKRKQPIYDSPYAPPAKRREQETEVKAPVEPTPIPTQVMSAGRDSTVALAQIEPSTATNAPAAVEAPSPQDYFYNPFELDNFDPFPAPALSMSPESIAREFAAFDNAQATAAASADFTFFPDLPISPPVATPAVLSSIETDADEISEPDHLMFTNRPLSSGRNSAVSSEPSSSVRSLSETIGVAAARPTRQPASRTNARASVASFGAKDPPFPPATSAGKRSLRPRKSSAKYDSALAALR